VSDASPLKSLSLETKALIIVSEFEARRMPMFQMRAVLAAIVRDDEERKNVIDLIEKDLRATGYPDQQIGTFLTDLIGTNAPPSAGPDASIQSTRRLRSPFALGFETPSDPTLAATPPPPDVGFIPRSVAAGAQRPSGSSQPIAPAPIPAPAVPRTGSTVANIPRRPMTGPIQPPSTPPAQTAPRAGGSNSGIPPVAAEPLQPVGQKSLIRHDLAFGKVQPSLIPPGAPGSGIGGTGAAAASRPVVLVADDDKRIRLVFRLRLEASGFVVIEMGDGQEAWERLQQSGIDLAVLDMKMPGLHGLEVISRMVDKQINIPVIVCSAYDQLENEFVIQTHPKLKYLVKPVSPDVLVASARELLAAK
jgi:CheY-like chemotaxis protein